jgi:glutamate/tyrosine decarboxylase-like PLP-dependent enzyme
VQEATERLIEGINAIPELRVLGEPAMCMFSFTSEAINVFQLADAMDKRGWYIQGQFSTPNTPRSLHVSVNYGTVQNVDAMLADLLECVDEVRKAIPLDSDSIRAMVAQAMQDPNPEEAFAQLAQVAGITGTQLPDGLAFINEVLDAMPDELANIMLINFFNDLYT